MTGWAMLLQAATPAAFPVERLPGFLSKKLTLLALGNKGSLASC